MTRECYPKNVFRICEWCGAYELKYTERKQDVKLLHFCSETDHQYIYGKHVRNKKEMMGLTCAKHKSSSNTRPAPRYSTISKVPQKATIWRDEHPQISGSHDEYLEKLRKHKMNTWSTSQATAPCRINERTPNWKEEGE